MTGRILLTVAAAGLLCAQLVAAQTAKPAGKPSAPWAKIPALPTACYSSQDRWSDQNDAALASVGEDHDKQSNINDAIRQKSVGTDMMGVAARLQQKMMEDPANAQKYMEQMLQQNQRAQVEVPAKLEKEQQIEAEADAVTKRYVAALTQGKAAGSARLDALTKKYKPARENAPDPDWVTHEKHAILKEWDRAYVATCAQWWSASGPFHSYMKRYRDFLVLERVPHQQEFLDKPRLDSYKTMGVDATGWRTTTDYEAAEDYMKMAAKLFGQRESEPLCRASEHCQ
jgi:hypothetical protein